MILVTGHLKPERFQIDEARVKADDSFVQCSSEEFMSNFPQFERFTAANDVPILLEMRNVEPHSDDWVGNGNVPRTRRAIFWLLEGGGQNGEGLVFGCGAKHIRMEPGDFVIFNDAVDHWVMSEKLWRGAAVQLQKAQP